MVLVMLVVAVAAVSAATGASLLPSVHLCLITSFTPPFAMSNAVDDHCSKFLANTSKVLVIITAIIDVVIEQRQKKQQQIVTKLTR